MKKLLPVLAVATMMLAACSGPSAEDFRLNDQQGNIACIHFGSGYADPGTLGATNMKKAAEHGSKSSAEQIRSAVDTDAAGVPVITDKDAFKKACESQGIKFN